MLEVLNESLLFVKKGAVFFVFVFAVETPLYLSIVTGPSKEHFDRVLIGLININSFPPGPSLSTFCFYPPP